MKPSLFLFLLIGLSCTAKKYSDGPLQQDIDLIYYNEAGLYQVKKDISNGNAYYVDALNAIRKEADKFLEMEANPVIHKSQLPPSGDKHDYLSPCTLLVAKSRYGKWITLDSS